MRPIEFMIGGGVSVPVSDAGDVFKTGANGLAGITFHSATIPFGLRAAFTYQRWDIEDLRFAGVTVGVNGHGQLLGGLLDATFELPLGAVRPHVTGGVGIYHFKVTSDDRILSGVVTALTGKTDDSQTKWGLNGGAGVKLGLGRVSAFVEGHIDNVYTKNGVIGTKNVRVVPVTFGLAF